MKYTQVYQIPERMMNDSYVLQVQEVNRRKLGLQLVEHLILKNNPVTLRITQKSHKKLDYSDFQMNDICYEFILEAEVEDVQVMDVKSFRQMTPEFKDYSNQELIRVAKNRIRTKIKSFWPFKRNTTGENG